MDYSDEHHAKIREMWARGLSCSQMAAEFARTFPGAPVTRNSMIGKVTRLGLPQRLPSPKLGGMASSAFRRKRDRRTSPLVARGPQDLATEALPAAPEDAARDPATLVQFADLEDGQCRFPIGDPQAADFGFCGETKVPGLPYCAHHAQRCYEVRPMKPRAGYVWKRRVPGSSQRKEIVS